MYNVVTSLPEDAEKATVRKVSNEAVIFEGSAITLNLVDEIQYDKLRELYRGWV